MNYDTFSSQLKSQNYARSNLFEVFIGLAGQDQKFVCKSASLPATSVGVIEVPYQNRKLKVPGDRTFQDWTVTIINDESMSVRKELLAWQNDIQGFQNFGSNGDTPRDHHRILTVTPMDRTMGAIGDTEVDLYGWPSEIGSIDLSWETADTVQEYTVTFSITHDNSVQ
jgi:hypothetical protein